jgi:RNA polymerase sigma-70 factor (ECF subfamily)
MLKNEQNLVEGAIRHDPQAFGKLYELYFDRIYTYLYFKTMQRQEAEDLTERVFLKAWEAIGSFHWQGYPFSTWLYRIAHNQLIDHYRAQRELVPLEVAEGQVSSDDPWHAVEQATLLAQVSAALKHLTPDQERVVRLRYFEGYSIGEIAGLLGKAPDAIRAMQHRALRSLQPRLGGTSAPTRKARAHASVALSI